MIEALGDDGETVIDLVAWAVEQPGRFARLFGDVGCSAPIVSGIRRATSPASICKSTRRRCAGCRLAAPARWSSIRMAPVLSCGARGADCRRRHPPCQGAAEAFPLSGPARPGTIEGRMTEFATVDDPRHEGRPAKREFCQASTMPTCPR